MTSIRFGAMAASLGALLLAGCGGGSAITSNDVASGGTSSQVATTPAAPAATGALPPPTHSVAGRIATITLPYRTADGLIWVSATKMSDAAPFMFKGLDVKPGAGPSGTDLSVFTYEADRAGTATLKFGLVPPGKMLIGPSSMVYTGPVSARYEAIVSAP